MHAIPCSCGGENSRCFKCDGTGMVPRPALQKGRPHPAPGALKKSASGRRVRSQNGTKRNQPTARSTATPLTRKAAPPPPELPPTWPADNKPTQPSRDPRPNAQAGYAPKPKQVQKASPPLVCCPACGVQTSNLAKHHRKAHTAEGAARRLERRRRREAEAAKDRLAQLRNKPPGGVRATRLPDLPPLKPPLKVRKRGKGKQAPLEQRTRPVESRGPGEPSRFVATPQGDSAARDATYGWGGSLRDHGQFGSYPSHDDMGDESNP